MRRTHLSFQIVDFIPEEIQDGVLYVSFRFGTAVHKCCCGCGEEVITPMGPTDWSISIEDDAVTLHPSIGNWSYSCRSHYLIRRSKVVWAGDLTDSQIEHGRELSRRAKQAYFVEVNRAKARQFITAPKPSNDHPAPLGLWERIRLMFTKLFGD